MDNYGLTLEGLNAGLLKAVDGGAAIADVVAEKPGPDNIVSAPGYVDVVIKDYLAATLVP